jgi:hypothetical protein
MKGLIDNFVMMTITEHLISTDPIWEEILKD